MTLLEVTVVIVVLLSLIAILFVGAQGWKRGADRSGCILNIRNVQGAVRAYQNTRAVADGTAMDLLSAVIGPDNYLTTSPECPAGGAYQHIDHMPFPGELVLKCDLETSLVHFPADYGDW